MNVVVLMALPVLGGLGICGTPLALKCCIQALEDLIVPPGVAALWEAGLAASHDLNSVRVAGAGWILAIPLMKGVW